MIFLIRVTYCIRRHSDISFRDFVAWCNKQFIPYVASIPIVKENACHFIVSYTSHFQTLGIPQRKYDALFDFWFENFDEGKTVLTDSILYYFRDEAKEKFLDLARCSWVVTRELSPVFTEDATTKVGSKAKIKFTTLLTRSASMSFEQFTKHHRDKHIDLFSSTPIVKKNVRRYVVSHKLVENDNTLSNVRYDGVVEFWFDNVIDMYLVFINPTYLLKVRPDENRFLELSKCDFVISKELAPVISL